MARLPRASMCADSSVVRPSAPQVVYSTHSPLRADWRSGALSGGCSGRAARREPPILGYTHNALCLAAGPLSGIEGDGRAPPPPLLHLPAASSNRYMWGTRTGRAFKQFARARRESESLSPMTADRALDRLGLGSLRGDLRERACRRAQPQVALIKRDFSSASSTGCQGR